MRGDVKNFGFASGVVDKSSVGSRHEGLLRDLRERQHSLWCRQSPSVGKIGCNTVIRLVVDHIFRFVCCRLSRAQQETESQRSGGIGTRRRPDTSDTEDGARISCWVSAQSHLVVHIHTAVRVRRSPINEVEQHAEQPVDPCGTL